MSRADGWYLCGRSRHAPKQVRAAPRTPADGGGDEGNIRTVKDKLERLQVNNGRHGVIGMIMMSNTSESLKRKKKNGKREKVNSSMRYVSSTSLTSPQLSHTRGHAGRSTQPQMAGKQSVTSRYLVVAHTGVPLHLDLGGAGLQRGVWTAPLHLQLRPPRVLPFSCHFCLHLLSHLPSSVPVSNSSPGPNPLPNNLFQPLHMSQSPPPFPVSSFRLIHSAVPSSFKERTRERGGEEAGKT